FADVGEDTNLLLRCCAAVLKGEASPDTLVDVEGAKVRERFGAIVNGIKGAIDFVRRNVQVQSVNNLPFLTLLVPLSAFFEVPENSFRIDSVNTKTFVLMLANRSPLSFVSAAPIDLEKVLRDYNRNEFHHLYPRAYLRDLQAAPNSPKNDMNCLANFCFMSRVD